MSSGGHLREDTSCAWYCASSRAPGCSGSAAAPKRASSAACSASPVGRSASAVPVAMRKPTSTSDCSLATSQSPAAKRDALNRWSIVDRYMRYRLGIQTIATLDIRKLQAQSADIIIEA